MPGKDTGQRELGSQLTQRRTLTKSQIQCQVAIEISQIHYHASWQSRLTHKYPTHAYTLVFEEQSNAGRRHAAAAHRPLSLLLSAAILRRTCYTQIMCQIGSSMLVRIVPACRCQLNQTQMVTGGLLPSSSRPCAPGSPAAASQDFRSARRRACHEDSASGMSPSSGSVRGPSWAAVSDSTSDSYYD